MLSVGRARSWPAAVALAGLLGAGPIVVGCGEQKAKQENIDEVVQAQQRARRVKAQADVQAISTALQAYSVEHGRFPDSLDALPFIQEQRIDASLYAYDPASGQVSLREP